MICCMGLTTTFLVNQLRERLAQDAAIAARAGSDARDAAQNSATALEKREDSRTMIEFSNLAHAQAKRVELVRTSLAALDAFASGGLKAFTPQTPVAMGAIVDALGEDDTGSYGRTFVVLPVGAGEELAGPGGDGIITVITPASPVGRAFLGKRVGEVAEVLVRGEPTEWEIVDVTS
jgi:transcription elongation GreA/GreB family factor